MNAQPAPYAGLLLPADDDADVRAAVTHFTPSVVRIRELSAMLFNLPNAGDRAAVTEEVDSLVADIATRAERLSLTVDDLFRLINAELAMIKGDTKRPHGEYLRHLVDEVTRTAGDVAQVTREVERLRTSLARAEDQHLAADRACAGYAAGWARRGEAR